MSISAKAYMHAQQAVNNASFVNHPRVSEIAPAMHELDLYRARTEHYAIAADAIDVQIEQLLRDVQSAAFYAIAAYEQSDYRDVALHAMQYVDMMQLKLASVKEFTRMLHIALSDKQEQERQRMEAAERIDDDDDEVVVEDIDLETLLRELREDVHSAPEAIASATVILTADPEWTCTCGNDAGGSGFYACDEHGLFYRGDDGEIDGPPVGSGWRRDYKCYDCGQRWRLDKSVTIAFSADDARAEVAGS